MLRRLWHEACCHADDESVGDELLCAHSLDDFTNSRKKPSQAGDYSARETDATSPLNSYIKNQGVQETDAFRIIEYSCGKMSWALTPVVQVDQLLKAI